MCFVYKKVLVTGGAGFIGSNLCKELAEQQDIEIISLDNYSTGSVDTHVNGVTYISGSTCDINTIEELEDFQPDLIFHLGEYSRVEQSIYELDKVWKNNILGTHEVLKYAKAKNSKIVYAGSSTKFGDGGLTKSETPYAWAKASNSIYVQNFCQWNRIKYAIVYFYNAFGPNEILEGNYATLVGIFQKKMRNKEPLTVVKPGTQRRNFTHVFDIVNGLKLVAMKGEGDGFGIGCDKDFSVLEVASMFGGKIKYLEQRLGNRLMADLVTEKTKAIGWKANYSLEEYIESLRKSDWG